MATPELVQDRAYRNFMYLPTDRVADEEFGFWPQTIRRWIAEGFPKDVAEQMGEAMFHQRFEEFIGSDHGHMLNRSHGLHLHWGINPPFQREVLEDQGATQIIRDESGVVARWWKSGSQDASIPEYLDFPVKDRASWQAMKDRYRHDDPVRRIPSQAIDEARTKAAQGYVLSAFAIGFYGQLRNWVGTEPLSYLIYDDPDLVREMCDFWAHLVVAQIRQYPDDIPIHLFSWWEDMAFNGGPLVSPQTFETVMIPGYQRIMDEARRHGCTLGMVDSDGNIHTLVNGWMSVGVNIMFPNEVAAGTDMFMLRNQWGKAIRFKGGIDKKALAAGRDAIDRELDRIAPLVQDGGYIPTLDHLVPPDISLSDYLYYRQQKMKLIGKK